MQANDRGMTALLRAVEEGYIDVMLVLLANGADPNQARTSDGLTPLITALVKGNVDMSRELILKGADVNKVYI